MSDKDKVLNNLINSGLLALGYLMAKDKVQAGPIIYSLAQSLKNAGSDCDYLDPILKGTNQEGPEMHEWTRVLREDAENS